MAVVLLVAASPALGAGGSYVVEVGRLSTGDATGVNPSEILAGLNVNGAGGMFGIDAVDVTDVQKLTFAPPAGTRLIETRVWPSVRAYGWPSQGAYGNVTSTWGDWGVDHGNADVDIDRRYGSGGTPLTATGPSLSAIARIDGFGSRGAARASLLFDKADLTLADDHDPEIDSAPAAGTLFGFVPASGWHTASHVTLTATVHDEGSGVQHLLLREGASVWRGALSPGDTRCRSAEPSVGEHVYVVTVPCPTAPATYAVDVSLADLGDGAHSFELGVEDAAGNQRWWPARYDVRTNAPGGSLPDPGTAGPGGCTYAEDGTTCVAPSPGGGAGGGGGGAGGGGGGGGNGGNGTVPPSGNGGGGSTPGHPTPAASPAPVVTAPPIVVRQGGNGAGWTARARMCAGRRASCDAARARTGIAHVTVPYGRRVPIAGRLTRADGRPIAGAAIEVRTTVARPGAQASAARIVRTDADGVYRWTVPVGPSRTVTFGYRARLGDERYARSSAVEVAVVPRIRLRTNHRTVRNHHAVTFLGRIDGAPRWARRTVEMRVRVGGAWQTFGTAHLRHGRFRYRYVFQRTTRRTTYHFRVRALPESGWPFAGGRSHKVRVTVRP